MRNRQDHFPSPNRRWECSGPSGYLTPACVGAMRGNQLNSCPFARLAVETDPATQTIRDDVVDDMKAEAGAALIPAGGEERIEGFAPNIKAHTAAVVRKNNFDTIMAGSLDLDVDEAFKAVGKRMRDRIEEEVGQHLPVRVGITVHRQIGLAIDGEGKIFLFQARTQTHDDLFGQITEIEDALIGVVLVGRYLLERLDQVRCAIEIRDQLRRCLAADIQEVVQSRPFERASCKLVHDHGRLAHQ